MSYPAMDDDAPYTFDEMLFVLNGEVEWSADERTVMIRASSYAGRTFEVHLPGALTYLETFRANGAGPRASSKQDALSYFDLEIQEFTGTTPPEGDPVIIDEEGPRLTDNTVDFDRPWLTDGGQFYAIDPRRD